MKRERGLLYTVSLNHFSNDGATTIVSTLFPVMLGIFHLDYIEVGIMVAVGLFVNAVGQPLVGRYADRVSSEKLLMAGMALILASMFLFVVATDFLNLLLITVLLRIGSSFFHPVGLARVSRTHTGEGADSAMGFMVAFGNVGVLTAFLISGLIYDRFGWGAPFYVWAAITTATILATWVQGRREASKSASGDDEIPVQSYEPARVTRASQQWISAYRRLLGMGRSTAFLLVVSTVVSAAYTVFTSFGNLTLVGRGLDIVDSNLGVALFAGMSIVGSFSYGRLRQSFSNGGLVAGMTLVGILSYVVMTLASSPWVDLPMFVLAGFTTSTAGTATLAMAAVHVDAEVRGAYFGVVFAANTLGQGAMSAASGFVAEVYGVGAPYAIITLLSIPIVFWAASIRGRRVRVLSLA